MNQNTFFINESDNWYERNYNSMYNKKSDDIINIITENNLKPTKILEIGCSIGWRLNMLHDKFNCECHGIDLSEKAITEGKILYPHIKLDICDAKDMKYNNNEFDMVILGYFLYIVDRHELFKIAYQIDRILKNNGYLVINDNYSNVPSKLKYYKEKDVYVYIVNNTKMFTWNPSYEIIFHKIINNNKNNIYNNIFHKTAISVLYKNEDIGYVDIKKNKTILK